MQSTGRSQSNRPPSTIEPLSDSVVGVPSPLLVGVPLPLLVDVLPSVLVIVLLLVGPLPSLLAPSSPFPDVEPQPANASMATMTTTNFQLSKTMHPL